MEYQIGDFSKISRLTIKTLRYYHECGILIPSCIDKITGYRYYNEALFEKVNVIVKLKNLDFSLNEIKEILENCTEDSEVIDYIKKKHDEIIIKLNSIRSIEKKIEHFIKQHEEETNMADDTSEIIIKNIPDILIASTRFKGKYEDVGKVFGKIGKFYNRYIKGKAFSLYYDKEYKEANADIEAGFEVKKELGIKDINSRILKGGQAITIIHKGSYETIGKSYKKLLDFINTNKIITEIPSREIYIKGPGMILKGNPKNYITEIQLLIKK